jgi:hypothetical protein
LLDKEDDVTSMAKIESNTPVLDINGLQANATPVEMVP